MFNSTGLVSHKKIASPNNLNSLSYVSDILDKFYNFEFAFNIAICILHHITYISVFQQYVM